MDNKNVNCSLGLGKLSSIITIIFVLAKLFGIVNWSWWIVFLPTIITTVLSILLLIIIIFVVIWTE